MLNMEDDFITLSREKCLNEKVDQVLEWAKQRNIINGSTPLAQYAKAVSEIGELGDAILKNNKDELENAIGDSLVCLINLAEMCSTDIDICLGKAYEQIKDRKGVMWNGVFVKETDVNYERIIRHVETEQSQIDALFEDSK